MTSDSPIKLNSQTHKTTTMSISVFTAVAASYDYSPCVLALCIASSRESIITKILTDLNEALREGNKISEAKWMEIFTTLLHSNDYRSREGFDIEIEIKEAKMTIEAKVQ